MSDRPLADVDLNLLVVLDALLAESSVTAAARRIGRTQSATSHALMRLRELYDDPLLVRTSRGMTRTPRAEQIMAPLRALLLELDSTIRHKPAFDPSTARRRFVLSQSDYTQLLLLPRLLADLAKAAPGIDIDVRIYSKEGAARLESGSVDLALGVAKIESPGIYGKRLFSDTFISIVRKNHPCLARPMTIERFAELSHILVAPHGGSAGVVDDAFARAGLQRRIALSLPQFLVAPFVVAQTDLCLTLPAMVARAIQPFLRVRSFSPPLEVDGFSVTQYWHERSHRDPAHLWLRATIAGLASSLR